MKKIPEKTNLSNLQGFTKTYFKLLILVNFSLFSLQSWGLMPMESLILGDLSNKYIDADKDPIDYIFKDFKASKGAFSEDPHLKYKSELGRFRGFVDEGFGLDQSCRNREPIQYSISWERDQVKRSMIASLQYVGLDLTLRALSAYAKYFDFSEDEYQAFTNNLIGNYCSQNVSIISLKELHKNFMVKFKQKHSFALPSVKGNPLFPQQLVRLNSEDKSRQQEFAWTIELFKSFCSWGSDTEDFRLMVPLIRSPVILAFVIRQMTGKRVVWEPIENKTLLIDTESTVQVRCENVVCRRTNLETLKRKLPRSVGSNGLSSDLERLYCQDLRDAHYVFKGQVPKIAKKMKNISFDDQNLMTGQFFALLTGIPDFLVQADKFNDGLKTLRSSVDHTWNHWAEGQNRDYRKEIYYEEALTIELIDRKFYFNPFHPRFRVEFDINMGEFDRTNVLVGKVKTKFYIKLSNKFLAWVKELWKGPGETDKKTTNKVLKVFRAIISDQVKEAQTRWQIAPWKGDIENLIIKEILEQVLISKSKVFENPKGIEQIPIHLNYGLFALRYFHFKWLAKQNKEKRREQVKSRPSLSLRSP